MASWRSAETHDDTIDRLWRDWHDLRRRSGVSVPDAARALNSNRSTVYELGKPTSKTRQFQGVPFLIKALDVIGSDDQQKAAWLSRYARLADLHHDGDAGPSRAMGPQPPPRQLSRGRIRFLVCASAALVLAVSTVSVGMWLSVFGAGSTGVVVEVQNMIAVGRDGLIEDSTPSYLSTRPESFCAELTRNCKVPGSEMWSGVSLAAVCQRPGEEISNFNEDLGNPANPHRWRSTLWYGVELPDRSIGYISESWIRQVDRGGAGLPSCP